MQHSTQQSTPLGSATVPRSDPRCGQDGRSAAPRTLPSRVALTTAALWLLACAHAPADLAPEVTLTFLETTDFHGAMETTAKDRGTDRPIGGAAYLAAVLTREEADNPDGTLLLDAGDIYQGSAISNLSQGRVSIDYMNLAGFDAAAVGNHEFDFGIATMEERMEQAHFPLLCANVVERASGEPPTWARPYALFTRHGVRIAVIGLITPETPKVTLPENVAHLEFQDPAPVANALIRELVPVEADLAVILCHIGGTQDHEGGPVEGEVEELAVGIEGEAAILGGHTHRTVTGTVGGVPVVEAGSLGRWVGRLDLRWNRRERAVVGASSEMITVFADSGLAGSVAPHPEVLAALEDYRREVAPVLDEVVGQAAVPLIAERAECPMGNWMADVVREAVVADIGLQNPGGVRSSIEAGPIRYADIYRVMPFDNTIVVARMSGAEVRAYLETSAARGSFLHASGLRYTVDYARPEGSRLTDLFLPDGSVLDPGREYRVAVNNFMAQGGDDLPVLQGLPTTTETSLLVRDAMLAACRTARSEGRALAPTIDGRIRQIGR